MRLLENKTKTYDSKDDEDSEVSLLEPHASEKTINFSKTTKNHSHRYPKSVVLHSDNIRQSIDLNLELQSAHENLNTNRSFTQDSIDYYSENKNLDEMNLKYKESIRAITKSLLDTNPSKKSLTNKN